jgi:cobaltochelatase CobS
MYRDTSRDHDRFLADYLALLLRERSRITVDELGREGLTDPWRAIRRAGVVARLGQHGLRVGLRRGGRELVAKRLEPLDPAAAEAPSQATDAQEGEYFYQPPEAGLVERMLGAGLFPYLSGPTGCGKSTLLERCLCSVAGPGPVFKVSMTAETSLDDIFGTRALRDGRTLHEPGPLLLAMRTRRPIQFEELDAAPPEVLFGLHELLTRRPVHVPFAVDESGAPLVVDPWGPGTPFLIGATGNTTGRGDRTGLYRGAQVLNAAFLDRWVVLSLRYPEPQAEVEILRRRTGVDADTAARIVRVANLARAAGNGTGEIILPFSVRRSWMWAMAIMRMRMSTADAFCLAVLEAAGEEDRTALCEMYQRVFGEPVDPDALHRAGGPA